MTDTCGTLTGYHSHYMASEEPCTDCRQAKAVYDAARRHDPRVRLRDRLCSRAQSRAKIRLVDRHRDEYRLLYAEEKARAVAEAGVDL